MTAKTGTDWPAAMVVAITIATMIAIAAGDLKTRRGERAGRRLATPGTTK